MTAKACGVLSTCCIDGLLDVQDELMTMTQDSISNNLLLQLRFDFAKGHGSRPELVFIAPYESCLLS